MDQPHVLLEPEAIQLLHAYGIPYPDHGIAQDVEEAAKIADRLGYPVVLKVISRDVVHKSDAGGVALGLENAHSVRHAYSQIVKAVGRHVPEAEIQGMLVCKHVPSGLEVIVGTLKDLVFGSTVMFGLGGIFAEVLKDVSFRVAPLEHSDAQEMIREIRGYPLLKGTRGQRGCDIGALIDLVLKVSRMVMDRPDIEELDLNPVRVFDEGLLVLDARVVVRAVRDQLGLS